MNQPEVTDIIEKAKRGDPTAKNTIIKLIQDNGYMKAISHYLYLNRLLEPDDVRSEFWIGVVLALPKVKTEVGDPLFYLAWQGANRVKSQLRKKIGKGVIAECNQCSWIGRLTRINSRYVCPECGNEDIKTWQKEINETSLTGEDIAPPTPTVPPNQIEIDIHIDIEYFKSKLSPQELRVFILITDKSIDRDHESNYLHTIADLLHISPQCINQYLGKIKKKLTKMMQEG